MFIQYVCPHPHTLKIGAPFVVLTLIPDKPALACSGVRSHLPSHGMRNTFPWEDLASFSNPSTHVNFGTAYSRQLWQH